MKTNNVPSSKWRVLTPKCRDSTHGKFLGTFPHADDNRITPSNVRHAIQITYLVRCFCKIVPDNTTHVSKIRHDLTKYQITTRISHRDVGQIP